ncbi:MAG: histidine phosphatase family protein [Rikenellaceae bacterium]
MSKLYLQRHTRPDIDTSICYGASDIPLAESFEGVDLPKVLARYDQINCPRIYTSPLRRCSELASRIAQLMDGATVIVDPRVMETNFGDWELVAWDDIFKCDEGKEWFGDYLHCRPPHGESFQDLRARARDFRDSMLSEAKDAIVVSHCGFIMALLVECGECSEEEVFGRRVEYGEMLEIEI